MLTLDDPAYLVITSTTANEMGREVSHLITTGYVPHGPMTSLIHQTAVFDKRTEVLSYKYIQPMIRKDVING